MRAVALLVAAGCAGAGVPGDSGTCSPSWDDFGRSFVAEYCDACHAGTTPDRHGAPASVTFDSEAEALDWIDRIVVRVEAREMPPGGGVSDDDIAELRAWADCSR